MKKTISTLIASLFMASILVPQVSTTASATETPNKRIVTYFPSWGIYQAGQKNVQVKDIAWDKVTHVNHGFFEINNSYQIQTTDSYADFENEGFPHAPQADWDKYPNTGYPKDAVFGHFGEYKYYKSKYPNVKLLISVGGWTRSDKFHEIAASPEKRKILANSMVDFMKKYNFVDGMDIDWEYPTVTRAPEDQYDRGCVGGPEDKQNFTLLLKDIRETFNANGMKDKLLTVAVSAGESKIRNTEPDKYAQYVDYIGVMTYDFAGSWDTTTGHLAGIYGNPNDADKSRAKFNMNDAMNIFVNDYKVPKDKLLGGTPLYSRGWGNVQAGPNGDGLFQKGDGTFKGNLGEGGQYSWFDLKNLEKAPGWTKYRDPIAKVPYLYNASTKQFLTYEDETSLQERINYINSNNYGGLIVWDASGDDFDGARTMHTILYNGLIKNNPLPPTPENKPQKALLTVDNSTNTGSFNLTINIPNNSLATSYKLYENNSVIKEGTINSNAFSDTLKITSKAVGNYTYRIDTINENGTTVGDNVVVTVKETPNINLPLAGVLSVDNQKNNGNYTVTLNIPAKSLATNYKLYENNTVVKEGTVTDLSFSFKYTVTSKAVGNYSYKLETINTNGQTVSNLLNVTVEKAPIPPTDSDWKVGTSYKIGDIVKYNGHTYKCTIANTALDGWTPEAVPALWQRIN
ncbi:chitinase family 18 [Clostridium cavendishii DSM 21758]|uniref:chitinase n=1 Tax=Clostridium cavendishii DSM 21758 TaxID=1121302 RepID=A0A1M6E8M2_9CLOT|nr:glycosyl hydrolase family 18 protein [Clostridium cavendishii]SHI81795.1 chitinase family 18 [Clostridium cavendishii DSM 21758]